MFFYLYSKRSSYPYFSFALYRFVPPAWLFSRLHQGGCHSHRLNSHSYNSAGQLVY